MEALARCMAQDHTDSRLLELLKQNATIGLMIEEFLEAMSMIRDPSFSECQCWLCAAHDHVENAIFDTGICQGHAHESLMRR